MNRLKLLIKEYGLVSIILLIFGLIVFGGPIFCSETFAWYNDQAFQHNIFYTEWYRVITESISNGFPSFYSWNTFLGTDFFASKILYCVGDFFLTPLFIIMALCGNEMPDMDMLLSIETIFCTVISGLTMIIYLKKFGIKNKKIIDIFAIIYALSGFAMMYAGTYMFHRFYCLLPLLFYGVEKYIQDNKKSLFAIIVALLFLQNYELMYSCSLFLILYFIFSYKLKENIRIKLVLLKSLPLIFSYLVGIVLCGFVILPLIYFLFSNPRVASFDYGSLLWNFRTVVSFLFSIISPAFNFRSDNPPYLFYTNEHFSQEFGIFATGLVLLGIVHLIKRGNSKEKRLFLISFGIILSFTLIRPLNMLVHGFSEPTLRWTFLLMFFAIIASSYAIDKYSYDKLYWREMLYAAIAYVFILVLYTIVYKLDINYYMVSIFVLLSAILPIFLYDYLLHNAKLNAVLVTVFVNLGLYIVLMVAGKNAYQLSEKAFDENYLIYHEQTDETALFRYYFDTDSVRPFSNLNLNASMLYDYRTTATYDSTYDATVRPFLDTNGFDSWIIDINQPELLRMLGVKFVGSVEENEIITELNGEFSFNLDNISVYLVDDFNSIGHTYSTYVDNIEDVDDWNNKLYIESDDLKLLSKSASIEKEQLDVIEYNRQYFKGNIKVKDECVLFVAIPYSEGWNVINQYGEKLKTLNVQGGFLGVIIDEDDQELSFYYGTPGLKHGILISVIGFAGLSVLIFIDARRKIRI